MYQQKAEVYLKYYYDYWIKRYSNPQHTDTNHFEWTFEQKLKKKRENDGLVTSNANRAQENEKQYISENKEAFDTFIESYFTNITDKIRPTLGPILKQIRTLETEDQRQLLLKQYTQEFLGVQKYAYSLNKDNDPAVKHFIDNLLLYFEPTRTLSQKVIAQLLTQRDLNSLGLCPLFKPNQEPALRIVAKNGNKKDPELIIQQGKIVKKDYDKVPCIYSFKNNNREPRTIIQLKVANQGILPKETFKPIGNNCPWLSIHNAHCLYRFYSGKDFEILRDLNNYKAIDSSYQSMQKSAGLQGEEIAERNELELKELLEKKLSADKFSKDFVENTSIIDNLTGFNAKMNNMEKKWAISKDDLVHCFIVQTTDELNRDSFNYRSHWYVIAVIKKGSNIEYVIMDSAMDAHLTQQISYTDTSEFVDTEIGHKPTEYTLLGNSYSLNRIIAFANLVEGITQEIDLESLRKESLPKDLKENTAN